MRDFDSQTMAVRMMSRPPKQFPLHSFDDKDALFAGNRKLEMLGTNDLAAAAARMGWPEGALEPVPAHVPTLQSPPLTQPPPPPKGNTNADLAAMDAMFVDLLCNAAPDTVRTMPPVDTDQSIQMELVNLLDELNIIPPRNSLPLVAQAPARQPSLPLTNTNSVETVDSCGTDPSQTPVWRYRPDSFERGAVRRATINLGNLRAQRHQGMPYIRNSATSTPMIRTPSQQSLAHATLPDMHLQQLLVEKNSLAHDGGFKYRPDSIQRRNTIHVGHRDQKSRPFFPMPSSMLDATAEDTTQAVIEALLTPPDLTTPTLPQPVQPVSMPRNDANLTVTLDEVNTFLDQALVQTTVDLPEISLGDLNMDLAGPQTPLSITRQSTMNTSVAGVDDNAAGAADGAVKKQRRRRTFAELTRDVACPFPGCERVYASSHSLQQHLRLKHPGLEPPNKAASKAQQQLQAHQIQQQPPPRQKRASSLPFLDRDIVGKLFGRKPSSSTVTSPANPPSFTSVDHFNTQPNLHMPPEAIFEEVWRT